MTRTRIRAWAVAAALVALVGCGPEAAPRAQQAGEAGPAVGYPLGEPPPGAPPFDAALIARLQAAWAGRAADYRPRSRQLYQDGQPKYINRLMLETSPYLRQHAHNPVNWFPWGDEAFETAKQLGRPVFLSVGYSTCHWCHVMEEESFDDEEIARYLNEHYIAIKVDREERPDVDSIYMTAVQSLTGRGGWPMSVWLTPDREPFYGGTYFPARDGDRGARVGFLTLLERLRTVYDEQPAEVARQTAQIVRNIRQSLEPAGGERPGVAALERGAASYRGRFDAVNGGPRGRPKFPSTMPVRFLLRYQRRSGDGSFLEMAALTLEKMAAGGIYDHVGGGFHRYATDARWLVPHFEKMLYDNALLTLAYLDGYQATGREDFARVAREILNYVARDMTSPEGAFYSATDADSLTPEGHAEEGWFFTWTPAEIEAALGKREARIVNAWYGVTAAGNFEGRNILHTPRPAAEVARELGISEAALRTSVERARETLYRVRGRRPAPLRDEKILTAWNGLMISAFARAGLVLGDDALTARAARAADFLLEKSRNKDGRLYRSSMDGRPRHNGYLDDHAFLAEGLLNLYEATSEERWLREAIALDSVLAKHYEDPEQGGFFMTSDDHETLLTREKPGWDGAEPSGNSIHTLNLLRLSEFTGDDGYRRRAARAMQSVGGKLERTPQALSEMLLAVDFMLDRPKQVIIVTPRSREQAEPLLARLRATYLPNAIVLVAVEGQHLEAQQKLVPLVANKRAMKRRPTAYVCEQGVCKLPTSDPEVFEQQLRVVEPLKQPEPSANAEQG